MLSKFEAEELMNGFLKLKEEVNKDNPEKSFIEQFKKQERICVEKFLYIVHMHTDRYKEFHNHDDLVQEGCEALVKAMNTYKPDKGIFFWWAHRHISTRISRQANLHTPIRYPLAYSRKTPPRRENKFPIMIEKRFCPDKIVEDDENVKVINEAIGRLTKRQRFVLSMAFGMNGDKPKTINWICKEMGLPRGKCMKILTRAMERMRDLVDEVEVEK